MDKSEIIQKIPPGLQASIGKKHQRLFSRCATIASCELRNAIWLLEHQTAVNPSREPPPGDVFLVLRKRVTIE